MWGDQPAGVERHPNIKLADPCPWRRGTNKKIFFSLGPKKEMGKGKREKKKKRAYVTSLSVDRRADRRRAAHHRLRVDRPEYLRSGTRRSPVSRGLNRNHSRSRRVASPFNKVSCIHAACTCTARPSTGRASCFSALFPFSGAKTQTRPPNRAGLCPAHTAAPSAASLDSLSLG